MPAPTEYSIQVFKEFFRRGTVQRWSNRYYFDGGDPGSSTAWTNLADGLVAIEKTCYPSNHSVVLVRGFPPGAHAVAAFNKIYTTAGTLATTGGTFTPSDAAATLRQATTKLSVKNHTVYCMSYFHGALFTTASGADDLLASQKSAIENLGTDWVTGITIGGRTYHRCTPDGHLVTGSHCSPYVGHRDFPR